MKTTGWVLAAVFGIASTASAETSLTVYNNNIAVVRHTDEMRFSGGRQTLTYTAIPAMIEPASVRFAVDSNEVTVLEQKYRYDFGSAMQVLRANIGRRIVIRLEDDRLVEGVLISAADDVIVRGDDGGIIILKADAIERYDLADLPEGLAERPTLSWMVNSETGGNLDTEISYITGGISWRAVYNTVVGEDEESLELSALVSLDNNSGMTYEDAALKLIAGTLNRARQEQPRPMMARTMAVPMAEDAAGFEERTISEYHLYELGRTVSLADGETAQIPLFDPAEVDARKKYNYDPRRNPTQVAVIMEFTNEADAGLGMPLPGGTVRVYRRDNDGALELVGEDAIEHTARDEEVKVAMGYAFDLAAERRVMNTRRISQRIQEQTVEISLRNRTDDEVAIIATEHLYGDWEIMQSTHEYTRKDATTLEFTVDVPAGGETMISYTVRIQ